MRARTLICSAALVILVAGWLQALLRALPPPFDDTTALVIPAARMELYPGGAKGAPLPANFSGVLALNERLRKARRFFKGVVVGSESVALTDTGSLVMIDRRGFVFRAHPRRVASMRGDSTGKPEERLEYELELPPRYVGPGRPLGFHVVGDDLFICDSLKGLLRLGLRSGVLEVISNAVHDDEGRAAPFHYANDLDVARDGTIYFTSCTDHPVARNPSGFYDTLRSYLLSAVTGDASGRLLRYDPSTRKTTVVLDGLSYANGVALSADESFVAVAETNHAR